MEILVPTLGVSAEFVQSKQSNVDTNLTLFSRRNQRQGDMKHQCLLGEDEEARCSQGCEGCDEVAAAGTSVTAEQHAACQHSYGRTAREGCRYLQAHRQDVSLGLK